MTNDEKYIREHAGKGNPFRVPDGYFDKFAAGLMEKLPQYPDRELELDKKKAKEVSLLTRLRPLFYVAATLVIAVTTFSVILHKMNSDADQQLSAQAEYSEDVFFDEEADYAMLDNYDIYACLTSE